MYYKASKDTSVIVITLAVSALLAYIIYTNIISIINQPGNQLELLLHGGSIFFVVFFYFLTYMFAPKGYEIRPNKIIVKRAMANKEILFSEIKAVRIANGIELTRPIRTFGVGGLFGNFGKFYSKGLGGFTMYGSQKKNYVVINTSKKTVVITPDDLSLVKELKSVLE